MSFSEKVDLWIRERSRARDAALSIEQRVEHARAAVEKGRELGTIELSVNGRTVPADPDVEYLALLEEYVKVRDARSAR